jgi:hypothetical protein
MFLEDSTHIQSQRKRISCILPYDVIFRPDAQLSKHHPSGWWELSVRTFFYVENLRTVPACICPDFSATRPNDISVRQIERFLSKTQIWEDNCNRLDDVYSRLDILLHKASRAYKVQPSRRQSSLSGCLSFMYENCVHQLNHPNTSLYGPDTQSLVLCKF